MKDMACAGSQTEGISTINPASPVIRQIELKTVSTSMETMNNRPIEEMDRSSLTHSVSDHREDLIRIPALESSSPSQPPRSSKNLSAPLQTQTQTSIFPVVKESAMPNAVSADIAASSTTNASTVVDDNTERLEVEGQQQQQQQQQQPDDHPDNHVKSKTVPTLRDEIKSETATNTIPEEGEDTTTPPPASNRNFRCRADDNDIVDGDDEKKSGSGAVISILRKEPSVDHPPLSMTSKRKKRLHVGFSTIQVRRYPMILGDNPSCPTGPPLGLGWEYEVLPDMNIMDFEQFRLRSRRFRTSHLILSHHRRVEILQRNGFLETEITAVEREMAKIQRQRRLTMVWSPCRQLEMMMESARRKFHRFLLCRTCEPQR
jgi:hypothetical protein